MTRPRSQLAHTLNPAKGWSNTQECLVLTGEVDPLVEFDIYAGRVVHFHTNFKLRPGCPDRGVPMFIFNNSFDPDVDNTVDQGDISDPGNDEVYVARPGGSTLLFPATGAYELESSEYDRDVSENSWNPSVFLTSEVSLSDEDAGLLIAGDPYEDTICGVVTRGVQASGYGGLRKALCFLTYFLPKDLRT